MNIGKVEDSGGVFFLAIPHFVPKILIGLYLVYQNVLSTYIFFLEMISSIL